ncbi:MAG: hypothetical protein JW741_19920 [Sedimentisphaerales bacterium]|nr:hypothetical protein [Sedimentisphaerales bacterium]
MSNLLTPHDVDQLLRYPNGRSARLAREGKLPCIILPDGEVRFDQDQIEQTLAAHARQVFAPQGGSR